MSNWITVGNIKYNTEYVESIIPGERTDLNGSKEYIARLTFITGRYVDVRFKTKKERDEFIENITGISVKRKKKGKVSKK